MFVTYYNGDAKSVVYNIINTEITMSTSTLKPISTKKEHRFTQQLSYYG